MPHETAIRLGSFFAILLLMGIAETLWPKRHLFTAKKKRWFSNLSVLAISTILVRLLVPILPTAMSVWCTTNGYGILNLTSPPVWLEVVVSILILDMAIYGQHVLFHKQRLLWKIHRMHHADTDIDASTGIRFHPIEIFLSMGIKLGAIALIGPSVTAVIIFEILLNGCALFNHANVRLPKRLDTFLRLLIVTPDMHRVHHSTDMREANQNFGFNFPWWDRLFGTYKAQPDLGHEEMKIGLNIFRDASFIRLDKILIIPFL